MLWWMADGELVPPAIGVVEQGRNASMQHESRHLDNRLLVKVCARLLRCSFATWLAPGRFGGCQDTGPGLKASLRVTQYSASAILVSNARALST